MPTFARRWCPRPISRVARHRGRLCLRKRQTFDLAWSISEPGVPEATLACALCAPCFRWEGGERNIVFFLCEDLVAPEGVRFLPGLRSLRPLPWFPVQSQK